MVRIDRGTYSVKQKNSNKSYISSFIIQCICSFFVVRLSSSESVLLSLSNACLFAWSKRDERRQTKWVAFDFCTFAYVVGTRSVQEKYRILRGREYLIVTFSPAWLTSFNTAVYRSYFSTPHMVPIFSRIEVGTIGGRIAWPDQRSVGFFKVQVQIGFDKAENASPHAWR